jgi:hypothetical protein
MGQACRLLTVRRGRRFAYVASMELPITNHFSPITSHGRDSGLAVRFQDLVLATSQGVEGLTDRPRRTLSRGARTTV